MRAATALLAILFLLQTVDAGNWAHWRGPLGNGVATEANPPTSWSETENIKWKTEIPGQGSGSPVVWEDRVFVVTAVPTESESSEAASDEAPKQAESGQAENKSRSQRPRFGRGGRFGRRGGGESLKTMDFKILCFNRGDGSLLWEQTATTAKPHEGTHSTNGFASASPCTDGERVYAHFGSRGLYCYTMDGKPKWKRDDLGKMQARAGFGEGSSPTLVDDKIIVPWDHEGPSYLLVLDKQTGETIWKVDRDEPTCWATPLVVEHNGQKQIIMNGQNYARAYDLETGKELWRCGGQTQRPVASPVIRDDVVFIGSGFRGSFLGAFRLGGEGDIEGTDRVIWTIERDTPDIGSPLLSENRLYFYKQKSGIVTCVDAETGQPLYSSVRLPGIRTTYASPVAAGGHVYFTGRSGTTVVIKDTDKFEVVAENSVGETVDATPAPVDDQLFIRGEKHLFCIAE
jgi:outer membrane protein assembly factor BamB